MDANLLTENNSELVVTQNEPTNIPDKFKDQETGELKIEALLKSYLALEKKLSSERIVSQRPDSPEAYCIDCTHGLFEPDAEINQRLYDTGFSQAQAQEVYNLAAERIVPLIMDVAAEFQAEREIERLISHFGSEETWREVARQLLNYGRKNLPENVLKGLASSYDGVMV